MPQYFRSRNDAFDFRSVCAGALEFYDKTYDRVNVKNEKPLRRIDRIFHTVTTTDDPVIRKLAKSNPEVNVFATDAILATLMCCTRSVYSWDIVCQKIGGKIFLDKRDNTEFGNFSFHLRLRVLYVYALWINCLNQCNTTNFFNCRLICRKSKKCYEIGSSYF